VDNWLILQNFYNGLTPTARGHVDATAGGAFFSLTIADATKLIEKLVSNQVLCHNRLETRQRGAHTINEVNLLNAKMDLVMKRMDDLTN
jgi:hypothetical protein